ncbi:hypothetical protein AB1Y20_018688 [Prymnesium parvum]|uniref:Uncharacterized protein n=1 Tax=Prymnesium parvum TaxID=97485 RepID=A0AB34JSI2_PRYPA
MEDKRPLASQSVRSDTYGRGAYYDNFVVRQPLARLHSVGRAIHFVSAAMLLLTGVLGLLSTFDHLSNALSSVMLSLYSAGFGSLLLRYELASTALADHFRARYGFMFTYAGRAAFLLLAGNLTWTISPLGWLTAILLNLGALFLGYILSAHPDFVSGRYSRVAFVDEGADPRRHAADPAIQAARGQLGHQ